MENFGINLEIMIIRNKNAFSTELDFFLREMTVRCLTIQWSDVVVLCTMYIVLCMSMRCGSDVRRSGSVLFHPRAVAEAMAQACEAST